MATPQFSAGSDEAKLSTEVNSLLQKERPWQLCANGQGVERIFQFKTFKAAWAFMDSVAASCKLERHHPEWSNTYNKVFVRWTTHSPAGLSTKDAKMAALCDELATRPESSEVTATSPCDSSMGGLADRAATAAGDCCSPAQGQSPAEEKKKKIEQVEQEEGAEGSVAGMGGQPS